MYSTWSVLKLKDELRTRHASTAGKKAVLIERLEAYDRNNLIGVEEELEDEIITIPAIDEFRDVNASTKLPGLTKNHIQEFADRFQVHHPKGRLLYENRCLVTLRIAYESSYAYFHAQCKAQMKKILYIVTLKLEVNGLITESHCECAAGSGLEAHCKHVFTVLHGIEDFVRTKTIILYKVCTEQIMMFKKPKKLFYESPMQSHKLPVTRRAPNVLYSPIKKEDIMKNYEDYVKNLAIGFAASSSSKMPFLQLIRPANPFALAFDHDYLKKSAEDKMLEELLLKNVDQLKIENIKETTKLQDASKDWHKQRSVRITASNFHAICHSRGSSRKSMANHIMAPKIFTSRATTHGKINEPFAIKKYETILSMKIHKTGLCISLTHPFLAASPDGQINCDTLVEVKCPFVARHYLITPNTVPYLYECNGELKLKKKHNYYTQIQGQLFCTSSKYCNLVIYTFLDMKVVYVERDEEFIADMVNNLTSFYEEYFRPALLGKYLYKNYDTIIKPN